MKLNRLPALLAAGALIFSCTALTGCSDSSNNNKSDNKQNSSASTVSNQSSQSSSEGFKGNQMTAKAELLLNQLYGSAGCIYLCEKNNVRLEDSYKKNITDEAKNFMSGLDLSIVSTSDLAKLICTDNVLSLGMKDKLFSDLYARYDEQTKLFDDYEGDTYEGLDEDTALTMKIASTDALWTQLNAFGIKDDKYDIKKLLSDAFNANVGKYDHNDIYKDGWSVSNELENIFYYYLITDSVKEINYKPVWDVLGPNYLHTLFESNENKDGFNAESADNLSGVTTDYKAANVLDAGIKPEYTPQEYYNTLDSDSAFLYNTGSDDFIYFEYYLFIALNQPSDLKLDENKYFTDNINKWLRHCYENNHGIVPYEESVS